MSLLSRITSCGTPTPRIPPSLPSPGRAIGRERIGEGARGLDVFVCHGEGRRQGRGEPGRQGEGARGGRGGRAGGGSSYLGRARLSLLAGRGRESPGEADKCGHIGRGGARLGAHGPRRLRPVEAAPARCARAPAPRQRSQGPAARSRPPAQVTAQGARGGGAPGSPWWQRAPSARVSPATRAAAPAENGPPRPPAPALSPPGPRVPSGRRCLWRSPPPWIMHRNFRKWIFTVFLCFGVLYVKLG